MEFGRGAGIWIEESTRGEARRGLERPRETWGKSSFLSVRKSRKRMVVGKSLT